MENHTHTSAAGHQSQDSDKNIFSKIDFNAPVILGFALVSLVVLIISFVTRGWSNRLLFSVYRSSWADPLTFLRMFLHVLGHADFQHYFNNMMLMMLVGPLVEEKYGSGKLLIMIVITAFVTGFINTLLFPTGLLGASGIVFMLIILSAASVMKGDKIPVTLIIVVVFYIGEQVVAGIVQHDNISQFTHIVGGICGGVFGILSAKTSK